MTKVMQIAQTKRDHCHRCGGLMVPEREHQTSMIEWRCVACGERVDPVILAHRQRNAACLEAEQLFAGSGNANLN